MIILLLTKLSHHCQLLSFTSVWVTAISLGLQDSSQYFDHSLDGHCSFSNLQIHLGIWELFQVPQLQLVSSSPCSIAFLILWQCQSTFSFRFPWYFPQWSAGKAKFYSARSLLFFLFLVIIWFSVRDCVICLNFKISENFVSYFLIIIVTPFRVFTPALADGFSLEFEWQVSSSLLDSSHTRTWGLRNKRTSGHCKLQHYWDRPEFWEESRVRTSTRTWRLRNKRTSWHHPNNIIKIE